MKNLLLLSLVALVNGQMEAQGTPPAVSINVQTPAGATGPAGPPGRAADSAPQFVRNGGYPVNQYATYEAVNPAERILYPPPVGPLNPPEVPNFYFNAGFNKAMGFQLPPFPGIATAATYPGGHTPLGEIMATKVDLLPSILKTGLFITVVVVVFKIIAHCLHTFAHIGKLKKQTVTLAGHVPVVSVSADAISAKSAKLDDSLHGREKRAASASPAAPSSVDFDAMIAQLDHILSIFDRK